MKSKSLTPLKQGGIQLNIASYPLQFIVGLSALIFVLNFTFEVLVSYGASFNHLIQVSCLIGVLGIWSLMESLWLAKHQDFRMFRALIFFLIVQTALSFVRFGFLVFNPPAINTDWLPETLVQNNWHYLFLILYSLIFIGIHRSIVILFTMNEKIHAENTERQMLTTLNALALARDNETGNHIIRTQNYVRNLALRLRQMGHFTKELNDQCIERLYQAAPLHDIGKVGIPDNILNKSEKFTDQEWEVMKSHASLGEAVLSAADVERADDRGVIRKAIEIAGGHHEKWDGTGYPRGIKGDEIPLSARIMALADVYDALVSERIYKAEWSHEDAINEIVSKRGTHFDPLVVDALIAEQENFLEIAQKYRDH